MKKDMKYVLGCIRRADEDFRLIEPGDRILIGVSGGKDSLLLLRAMQLYRMFTHQRFEMVAATLEMGLEPSLDTRGIQSLCDQIGVSYLVRPTNIGPLLFQERKEKNPCSLCAKMRRGMLTSLAKELGCNKVALGHHREDALETLFLSLLYEGRLHTFSPLTYLDRSDITQIRPMVYVPEKRIISLAAQLMLPVTKSPCPAAGNTKRQEMKELIAHMESLRPGATAQMLRALQDTQGYGLWDKVKRRPVTGRRGATLGEPIEETNPCESPNA